MNLWEIDQKIDTQFGTIACGDAGSGPPLVLAHGWPWSSYSWHRLIPRLADRFHLYWYDMPGYGASDKTQARTSLDIQGRAFAKMLNHWGLSKPMVLAHDFGGATTLRAHLLHGCDYTRLILMNVVAISPWGSAFFDHVGRHIDAFIGLPPHIHRGIVEAYIAGAFALPISAGDQEQLAAPWLTVEGQHSFYQQFAQADEKYTDEVQRLYAEMRCPAQILWGSADPWIPLERGQDLHSMMPGSEFIEISDAGHMPQLEAPDRLIDQLLKIL